MSDRSRLFQAGPDPLGRIWNVQFRWLQTAISIRHADTVDVKFFVSPDGGPTEERIVALAHSDLLKATLERGIPLSDSLCMRVAAAHVRYMIETWEDMDKTLVTLSYVELKAYIQQLHGETVPQAS